MKKILRGPVRSEVRDVGSDDLTVQDTAGQCWAKQTIERSGLGQGGGWQTRGELLWRTTTEY